MFCSVGVDQFQSFQLVCVHIDNPWLGEISQWLGFILSLTGAYSTFCRQDVSFLISSIFIFQCATKINISLWSTVLQLGQQCLCSSGGSQGSILITILLFSQTGYLILIAVMLIARTYCDVWMIENGTMIERLDLWARLPSASFIFCHSVWGVLQW